MMKLKNGFFFFFKFIFILFFSFGGFLMTDGSGLIICKNTLDVRMDLCYQESLPDIRRKLFPLVK